MTNFLINDEGENELYGWVGAGASGVVTFLTHEHPAGVAIGLVFEAGSGYLTQTSNGDFTERDQFQLTSEVASGFVVGGGLTALGIGSSGTWLGAASLFAASSVGGVLVAGFGLFMYDVISEMSWDGVYDPIPSAISELQAAHPNMPADLIAEIVTSQVAAYQAQMPWKILELDPYDAIDRTLIDNLERSYVSYPPKIGH